MPALVTDSALEYLSSQPLPPLAFDETHAEQVAHLALLIAQKGARVLPAQLARPFRDRTESERIAMQLGVLRVVQALVLLGWIEPPA
jgi:hypothetical protein